MSHTHERGQMQNSFSADMKDQLNVNGSLPSKPQMVNGGRARNPIPWPVSLSAGGPLNRASVTRLVATRVRGLLAERQGAEGCGGVGRSQVAIVILAKEGSAKYHNGMTSTDPSTCPGTNFTLDYCPMQ
ncbi:hypothetical protein VI817_004404 [Penicillium citrinum]|uniref:Uncharacterized protein n=1 Tax=Penicillium hetheringtonii TaxID=911720 RepID=A0AAD6GXL4_9EURO|nr:hypothetical protein N7450_002761 [Penicillium hetheringtonii]KAK5798113.1 hypothetical protein VI817_004404 [Penicillium citrinum]